MRCQMRSTSWLTGCGSETFCDIAAGRWPSQCEASYLWFMAPQWSCIFQSLCRVSKAGLLIGRRVGRVMMQIMIHARYNKFQPEEEEDKAGKLQIWCFSPDGGSSVFFSCDPNAINGDFTNVSRGRIMSHSKMSQTLSWLMSLWGNWLTDFKNQLYPFILFQNSSLSRKRKTCRLLGEQAAAWTMYLWVSKIHRWTDMKMDQKVWEIDLNAFAKRFRDISR